MLLEANEVVYLTALYDFLLREHTVNLTQLILHILHILFQHPYQLGTCRDHIVNAIEPLYSYIICDFMWTKLRPPALILDSRKSHIDCRKYQVDLIDQHKAWIEDEDDLILQIEPDTPTQNESSLWNPKGGKNSPLRV